MHFRFISVCSIQGRAFNQMLYQRFHHCCCWHALWAYNILQTVLNNAGFWRRSSDDMQPGHNPNEMRCSNSAESKSCTVAGECKLNLQNSLFWLLYENTWECLYECQQNWANGPQVGRYRPKECRSHQNQEKLYGISVASHHI